VDEEIIADVRERMDAEGFVKLEPKKVDLAPGQKSQDRRRALRGARRDLP
jgi:hypothetical protein